MHETNFTLARCDQGWLTDGWPFTSLATVVWHTGLVKFLAENASHSVLLSYHQMLLKRFNNDSPE